MHALTNVLLSISLVIVIFSVIPDFPDTSNNHEVLSPSRCHCLDCTEDTNCGGLWTAAQPSILDKKVIDSIKREVRIIAIVSHCLHDLFWLKNFTSTFTINEYIIVTKCATEVIGAPEGSTIIILPNIGRCDHTYAYFISNLESTRDYDMAIFLKDDRSEENINIKGMWRSLSDMVKLAFTNGFACGMNPTFSVELGSSLSAYHVSFLLKQFSLHSYSNRLHVYGETLMKSDFSSEFHNLGEWLSYVGAHFPDSLLTEVCYGGTFLVTRDQILAVDAKTFQNIEVSLSRGNNIQEGHYAERSWAGILSRPLSKIWEEAVLNFSDGFANISTSYVGTLLHATQPCYEGWSSSFLNKTEVLKILSPF